MIPAVADATVLIYLAKLDRLEALFKHHEPVLVPEPVYVEAVREGKEEGHADAVIIQAAVDEGHLNRTKPPSPPSSLEGLGLTDGDGSVLATAIGRSIEAVLTDDGPLRSLARSLDLTPRGTLAFLIADLEDGAMSLDGFLQALDDLQTAGYRISPSLHAKAVRQAVKIAENG